MISRRATTNARMLLLGMLLGGIVAALCAPASASESIRIPDASVGHRLNVERAAASYFGLDASPARLAAQIHQESLWRPAARSKFAGGLAQFTPATAAWLPDVCPELGQFDPWSPAQAILGAACYDAWLLRRNPGRTDCDSWAFALASYNGGESWLRRDQRIAAAAGLDALSWFANVELHTARAGWARRENRGYVRRILLTLEPAYIAAGWPGTAVCP